MNTKLLLFGGLTLCLLQAMLPSANAQVLMYVDGDSEINGKLKVYSPGNSLIVGKDAGLSNPSFSSFYGSSTENLFVGFEAGKVNSQGVKNTFLGQRAGKSNNSGFGNTFVGWSSGTLNTGASQNTFVGFNTGSLNVGGGSNTFIGFDVGGANTNGTGNTFLGSEAGQANETGGKNTFLGYLSGALNENGAENTYGGHQSGRNNVSGSYNSFYGSYAGFKNTAGTNNTMMGFEAGYEMQTGIGNVFVGHETGYNSTGNANTFLGNQAGFSNISGGSNTMLGSTADLDDSYYVNSTAVGNEAQATGSNQVVLGNTSIDQIGGYDTWTNLSDARFKSDVKENVSGLDFILKLRPVTYHFEALEAARFVRNDEQRKRFDENLTEESLQAFEAKKAMLKTGFIAQEVEKAADEVGYDFSGVAKPNGERGHYGLRYAEFTVPLVKAVQEMYGESEALKAKSERLEAENQQLKEQLGRLEGEVAQIRGMMERFGNDLQSCCLSHDAAGGDTSGKLGDAGDLPIDFDLDRPQLAQNAPNPFNESTLIQYYVPETAKQAYLLISTLDGKQLDRIAIEGKGYGTSVVSGGAYAAGTYLYTLVADGKVVATKQMVLTK